MRGQPENFDFMTIVIITIYDRKMSYFIFLKTKFSVTLKKSIYFLIEVENRMFPCQTNFIKNKPNPAREIPDG